jgi:APA family basic amino acid/polyamine antiporter
MAGQVEAKTSDGGDVELRRVLGPWQLIGIGIGAIIGAGIFVITGQAFVFACVGCAFAGLCYAELAAMIPASGGAYTYAYAAFGRLVGFMIGWDLCLEYGMAASTVAVGWGGYLKALLSHVGVEVPAQFASAPLAQAADGSLVATDAIVNLPAVGVVVLLTSLLIMGIRSSAGFNNAMVLLKVAIVLLVIMFGLPLISGENLTPFIPENTGTFGQYGYSGILAASGVIFFAYIGFDSVSVAAQEAKNPQRDLPIGILGSLAICTVLYILMSLTMVGLAHYSTLKVDAPVSVAIAAAGEQLEWLRVWVEIGAIAGLSTVILVSLYGQTRIFYAMSRDGFLPPVFAKVDPKSRTPVLSTIIISRYAHRVHLGLPCRYRLAADPAKRKAAVQDAALSDRSDRRDHRVRHDGLAAVGDTVVARARLACDRTRDLLRVRPVPREGAAVETRR